MVPCARQTLHVSALGVLVAIALRTVCKSGARTCKPVAFARVAVCEAYLSLSWGRAIQQSCLYVSILHALRIAFEAARTLCIEVGRAVQGQAGHFEGAFGSRLRCLERLLFVCAACAGLVRESFSGHCSTLFLEAWGLEELVPSLASGPHCAGCSRSCPGGCGRPGGGVRSGGIAVQGALSVRQCPF